ncbi:MAG: M3 family oligoendopeptidase [Akkermansiaceae bacterium]|nr:M3 family oligoendopeptidase [Armatimonadota bacterium]
MWNLCDLFAAPDDPRILETLATAKQDAEAFAQKYRGKVAAFSPDELRVALHHNERIRQESQKPVAFASLRFSADSSAENGAFLQAVREKHTAATLPLLEFDLDLARLPAEKLTGWANDPVLVAFRHYLQTARDRARFRLSQAEETVWEEAQNTGRRAWTRLFEEITSGLRFTVEGEQTPLTLPDVMNRQAFSDREARRKSADAITSGLEPHLRNLTYIHNTLIAEKATEDRLRGYVYQEEARHLSNELSPDVVETVVRTSEAGYPLVARYYRAKRRLLGLPELYHYDRFAPLTPEPQTPISYDNARDWCLSAFERFHPDYAEAAREFFTGNWIDGAVRPGKRGGAYCAYVTADLHPYIFINYLGKTSDVRTLAHELGHGVHTSVARPKGFFSFHGTLPMAEVASTFAEQLVFAEMNRHGQSDTARLALYAEQIEQAMSTIFRQTALYRFEQSAHRERRENGEVSTDRLGELWQSAVGTMFGDSVTLLPGHASWWAYIPHFVSTPFYVYAYTWGELLALALYKKCTEEGADVFAPKFLQFLRSGGSLSPQELVDPLGVDLSDFHFWQGALAVLEGQVTTFEALAVRVKNK